MNPCKWQHIIPEMWYRWTRIFAVCRRQIQFFLRSWLITKCLARGTWRVALVKQELLTLQEQLSLPSVFIVLLFLCSILSTIVCLFVLFPGHCMICLSVDLQFLITPLVSSNLLYKVHTNNSRAGPVNARS